MRMPVLPLRNVVLFPRATLPVTIGRNRSLRALEAAAREQRIATFAQLDPDQDDPDASALYPIGCTAKLVGLNRMTQGEGAVIAILEGVDRVWMRRGTAGAPYLEAEVDPVIDITPVGDDAEFRALERNLRELIDEVIDDAPNIPSDVLPLFHTITDVGVLADIVAA